MPSTTTTNNNVKDRDFPFTSQSNRDKLDSFGVGNFKKTNLSGVKDLFPID